VPERGDVIFPRGFADNVRPVIDFIAQCPRPNLQQPESERDQPSREPTFDLQFFLRFAETLCCPQRYVWGLGSPIWSRIRQTTVSTTAVTEPGRLYHDGHAGSPVAPPSS